MVRLLLTLSPVVDKLQGCDKEQWIAESYNPALTRDCIRMAEKQALCIETRPISLQMITAAINSGYCTEVEKLQRILVCLLS